MWNFHLTPRPKVNETRVVGVELGAPGKGVAGVGMGVSAAVITTTHLINLVSFSFPWLKQVVATLIYIGKLCFILSCCQLYMEPSYFTRIFSPPEELENHYSVLKNNS